MIWTNTSFVPPHHHHHQDVASFTTTIWPCCRQDNNKRQLQPWSLCLSFVGSPPALLSLDATTIKSMPINRAISREKSLRCPSSTTQSGAIIKVSTNDSVKYHRFPNPSFLHLTPPGPGMNTSSFFLQCPQLLQPHWHQLVLLRPFRPP